MWAAWEEFEKDMLAASTQASYESKLRTIHRALQQWRMRPFPPSVAALKALGATLKRGKYRSAASYLWLYKAHAQRLGHVWSDVLQRLLKDSIRSCDGAWVQQSGPRR